MVLFTCISSLQPSVNWGDDDDSQPEKDGLPTSGKEHVASLNGTC